MSICLNLRMKSCRDDQPKCVWGLNNRFEFIGRLGVFHLFSNCLCKIQGACVPAQVPGDSLSLFQNVIYGSLEAVAGIHLPDMSEHHCGREHYGGRVCIPFSCMLW